MPIWVVKAIWNEDGTEFREEWEENADTAHERRTHPFSSASRRSEAVFATVTERCDDLRPGEVRRVTRS